MLLVFLFAVRYICVDVVGIYSCLLFLVCKIERKVGLEEEEEEEEEEEHCA